MKILINKRQLSVILEQNEGNFKKGHQLKGSQWLFDFIRGEEGVNGEPVLKAYKKSGDVWTIGYGHTTGDVPPNVTKGMVITKDVADKIMYADLTHSANCIRRIFKQWEGKGIDVKITQSMFDALVSLTFNAGCTGIRTSDFIQSLKKGNYKETSEKIKKFALEKGFSGLTKRREKESERFCQQGGCK
jgi:lysozyme